MKAIFSLLLKLGKAYNQALPDSGLFGQGHVQF